MKTQKVNEKNSTSIVNGGKIKKKEGEKVKKVKKEKLANVLKKQKKIEKSPPKSVDAAIFQHFKDLTDESADKRKAAVCQLLLQLSETKDSDKHEKELAYTLKRLIRGCGASTNASRAGFFTGLVAFLKLFTSSEVAFEHILETVQKELHVGATIANKEDADAVTGKILACGALLHAGRLVEATNEQLGQIADILVKASKHRSYHSSLSYSFLHELLETVPQQQFEASVWPVLQKELIKPWQKQTLQTVSFLMDLQRKCPTLVSAKFLKAHFGGAELLNAASAQQLHKIFWDRNNIKIVTHPAFEVFGVHLAGCAMLQMFWTELVDPDLATPTKLLEIVTLRIATDILDNLSVENSHTVVPLLSQNFMKMFVEGLRYLKQNKDESLSAFYNDFMDALIAYCCKLTEDATKVTIIRRLILPPGTFNLEKFTGTRIVHQLINALGEQGVIEIFETYKAIFLAAMAKNPQNASESWLNFERMNAGYMLQHLIAHKSVQTAYKWRGEQLRFLLTYGIFHTTEGGEVCKKEAASAFSKDFGEQCKSMFFTSLQNNLSDLYEHKLLLRNLMDYCNELLQRKNVAKYIRGKKMDEQAILKAWRKICVAVAAPAASADGKSKHKKINDSKQSSNKLELVFHILLLSMGLQLFREPDMAVAAIDDLLKCMRRAQEQQHEQQSLTKKKRQRDAAESDEPAWIEVVVDLFLHLLSQNASSLRAIVNALFPHLCGNMILSAVHQILAMLDMKDGQNPLSGKGDVDESVAENDDNVVNTSVDSDEEATETQSQVEESSSDDDDDEEEEDDLDDADEGTVHDKLRNAISQALMENGAALDANDDMESIDLNDMNEEEGRKLDEALGSAFKALQKGGSAQAKKSKSYRVQTTTVMHFRIRVLDLVEIYLQQKPTMLFAIEIMLSLFDMLQYCVGEELKPLQLRVEKVLNKLTSLKSCELDVDLTKKTIAFFIRLILEKTTAAPAFDLINRLRNKCVIFLIVNGNRIVSTDEENKVVLATCEEFLLEFVTSRNPLMNITLIMDIFKLRWSGVWKLALTLAQRGLSIQTRTFRRIQSYEILTTLYKNAELQKIDEKKTAKKLKAIEVTVGDHIKAQAATNSAKQSAKEFQTMLEVLLHAQKTKERFKWSSTLASLEICNSVQELRRRVRLESVQTYKRYCAAFKLQVIGNSAPETEAESVQNEDVNRDAEQTEELRAKEVEVSSTGVQKRKHSAESDGRKQRKQKKQQRMETSSQGLNGGIAFASQTAPINNADEDDTI